MSPSGNARGERPELVGLVRVLHPVASNLARRGELTQALRWADLLVEIGRRPEDYVLQGKIQAQLGDLRAASRALREALGIDPDLASAKDALVSVERLARPLGPARFWGGRVATAVVVAAILMISGLRVLGSPQTRSSSVAGPGAEATDISRGDASQAALSAEAPSVPPQVFEQFASVRDELRRLGLDGLVTMTPTYEGTLSVRLAGLVPTRHLEELLATNLTRLAAVDTESIEVTGVYTVRSGDTLESIARWAYGDGRRWPELYRANGDRISDPDHVVEGWSLDMPEGRN